MISSCLYLLLNLSDFWQSKKSLKIPKGTIKIRNSKGRQHNDQKKKGQNNTIYKSKHYTEN